MTREEAKKAAEVMLAYANGEEIETLYCGDYVPCENPTFNWITAKGVENYRIKPKAKFDPKTLQPFDKVLVKTKYGSWKCGLFSNINDEESEYKYFCIGSEYTHCIPYNEETKHLVGTDNEAPEYYRYWED